MKIHIVPLLAVLCAGTLATLAQQPAPAGTPPGTADPFIKNGQPAPADPFAAEPGSVRECLVRMEVFAIPQTSARRAMQQFPKQADLHAWLSAELEKPEATIRLERMDMIRVRGGQRSKIEGIAEYPFPTTWDPPQISQTYGIGMTSTSQPQDSVPSSPLPPTPPSVPTPSPAPPPPKPAGSPGDSGTAGPSGAASALPKSGPPGSVPASRAMPPWPYNSATPTSFATKNTGWTLEVEVSISEDGRTADVNLAPQFLKPAGVENLSLNGEQAQTLFESRQLSTQILAAINKPTLAGTMSQPAETGAGSPAREEACRLLFITVTPVLRGTRDGAADEPPAAAAPDGVKEGLVRFEALSLPQASARRAIAEHPQETALYKWLDGELTRKDSGLSLENATTVRVRSGQRSRVQASLEFPGSISFSPPQCPQTISLPAEPRSTPVPGTDSMFPAWPFASPHVNSSNTKDLGWSHEVELTFGEDGRTVDLNIAPQRTRLAARLSFGAYRDVWEPVFEVQRCTAQLLATAGRPTLAGTFTPPTGTDIPGVNTSDRVWLLFVTVTIPE